MYSRLYLPKKGSRDCHSRLTPPLPMAKLLTRRSSPPEHRPGAPLKRCLNVSCSSPPTKPSTLFRGNTLTAPTASSLRSTHSCEGCRRISALPRLRWIAVCPSSPFHPIRSTNDQTHSTSLANVL